MRAMRDHTFGLATDRVRFGACGVDALVGKKLFDKVATEGNACACGPSKSVTCYLMSHFKLLRRTRFVFHVALFVHLLAQFIEALLAKIADGHDGRLALFKQIEHITNSGDARTLE